MSFLRIGTPHRKVRPPRGGPPCTEPLIHGANILRDPGAELHIGNTGGGPLGNETPGLYGVLNPGCSPDLAWTDGTYGNPGACAYSDKLGWAHASAGSQKPWAWRVVTTDPRSGTYHLKCMSYDDVGSGDHWLYPVGGNPCTPFQVYGTSDTWYSARIEAGDYARFGGWLKLGNALTSGSGTWEISFGFYDQTGTLISDTTGTTHTLTTSYTWYEFAMFAPATSYYLFVYPAAHWSSPVPTTTEIYADDFVLEVS